MSLPEPEYKHDPLAIVDTGAVSGPRPQKKLERSLGPVAVVALSISAMLGGGIFVLPGLASASAGSLVWLAYLLAALCVMPAAMCKAELATAMPTSGGTYVYLDRILGPFVGTIAGLALWASMLLKSAFALLGFGTYLAVLCDFPLKPTALILLGAIVGLNVLGIRNVSRAQLIVVTIAVIMLAVLVTLGMSRYPEQHQTAAMPASFTGILAATAFVFVSYNGVTKIAAIAEEVKNPGRNVPLAIFVSLSLVALIYALVAFTLSATLPADQLAVDLKPIHSLAESLAGETMGLVAAAVGVLTMVSMANAGLLAASRFPFAMSRDQLLPPRMEYLSARWGTPVFAIVCTGLAMGFAIAFLDVERLAKLASAMVISLYIAVNAAVVLFRESGVRWYNPEYRTPLYPWLQGFGILSGLFLLALLGPIVVIGAALITLPGAALFLLYGRRRVSRRGVMGVRGPRAELLQEPPSSAEDIEDSLTGRAAAVVALFGQERGPETLVEVGRGLAGRGTVEVAHVAEVPEQLQLGDALQEEAKVRSLRRRFFVMAEQEHFRLEFHSIASRDIVHTVHSVTRSVHCDWLVMAWRGRGRSALLPYNPIGWLINHLDCNLALFKDAGVRYMREIIVHAEPGPHDALVVGTADELAQQWRAQLTLVRFVHEADSDQSVAEEAGYLDQLSAMCASPTATKILRGKTFLDTLSSVTASYDLLVTGMPDTTLLREITGSLEDRLVRRAECSVLLLKTPRVRTHEAYEKRTRHVSGATPLLEHLVPQAVQPKIPATKKDILFQLCARVFEPMLEGASQREIYEALWERERTQNTSVGHGVALPHASLVQARSALVGVFTTEEPIDYQGPDGQRVDVFFVTISPPSERQLHLQLLSGIAALSLKTNLLERLRSAKHVDDVLAAVRECSFQLPSE